MENGQYLRDNSLPFRKHPHTEKLGSLTLWGVFHVVNGKIRMIDLGSTYVGFERCFSSQVLSWSLRTLVILVLGCQRETNT